MDFEDVIILGLFGLAGYWLYTNMQTSPVVVATPTPVTVAQSNAPNPTPVSTPATHANGTPCSIAPSCPPGQPCSALMISGVWNNNVCGPITLAGLGRYR